MSVELHHGDCLEVLRAMPDNSVDSVVTDPPYGLGFMGKEWDKIKQEESRPPSADETDARFNQKYPRTGKGPAATAFDGRAFQDWCELWATECLRVLKPGGHLLAFGGTRTSHRLACAIEDAGFEIRDSIAWHYGSGFPKSLNVSKALAKKGACRCEVGELTHGDRDLQRVREGVSDATGMAEAGQVTDVLAPMQRESSRARVGQGGGAGAEDARPVCPEDGSGQSSLEGRGDAEAAEGQLQGRSVRPMSSGVSADGSGGRLHHGAPSSHGSVGGSLPASVGSGEPQGPRPSEQRPVEPRAVSVERGPQAWGGWPVCERCSQPVIPAGLGTALKPAHEPIVVARKPLAGTVAANVLQHGTGALNVDGCRVGREEGDRTEYGRGKHLPHANTTSSLGTFAEVTPYNPHTAGRWPANVVLDESQAEVLGEPSRFMYVAKAPKSERPVVDGVSHPTVKPVTLLRWLVRLVTPPSGVVLEPFAGSGTTVEAALLEGFRVIAIEREADYLPLIEARIARVAARAAQVEPDLFTDDTKPPGRWPPNVVMDRSQAEVLDEQSGELKSGDLRPYERKNRDGFAGPMPERATFERGGDKGGASRFFPIFDDNTDDEGDAA